MIINLIFLLMICISSLIAGCQHIEKKTIDKELYINIVVLIILFFITLKQ